jgi:hypothetical protein
MMMSKELTDKLYDILNQIELNKVGKNDYNRYAGREKHVPILGIEDKLSEPGHRRKVTGIV